MGRDGSGHPHLPFMSVKGRVPSVKGGVPSQKLRRRNLRPAAPPALSTTGEKAAESVKERTVVHVEVPNLRSAPGAGTCFDKLTTRPLGHSGSRLGGQGWDGRSNDPE
eukprot:gene16962-biopygen20330